MRRLDAFPSSLYAMDVPLTIAEENYYINYLESNPIRTNSVMSQTLGNLQEKPEFEDLLEKFKTVVFTCLEEETNFIYDGFKISQMWANKFTKNQSIGRHTHPNHFLSAVYYLRVNADQGGTIFFNPNPLIMHLDMPFKKNKGTLPWSKSITCQPVKHNLILFPSWLEHCSEPNRTNFPRYTISFNVLLTGNMGIKEDLTYARRD